MPMPVCSRLALHFPSMAQAYYDEHVEAIFPVRASEPAMLFLQRSHASTVSLSCADTRQVVASYRPILAATIESLSPPLVPVATVAFDIVIASGFVLYGVLQPQMLRFLAAFASMAAAVSYKRRGRTSHGK